MHHQRTSTYFSLSLSHTITPFSLSVHIVIYFIHAWQSSTDKPSRLNANPDKSVHSLISDQSELSAAVSPSHLSASSSGQPVSPVRLLLRSARLTCPPPLPRRSVTAVSSVWLCPPALIDSSALSVTGGCVGVLFCVGVPEVSTGSAGAAD